MSDLVPREAAQKWLSYLREELPTVAFKCNTQEQRSNLGWKSSSKAAAQTSNVLQSSDCLGADTLIKLLKNYSRSHEVLSLFSWIIHMLTFRIVPFFLFIIYTVLLPLYWSHDWVHMLGLV